MILSLESEQLLHPCPVRLQYCKMLFAVFQTPLSCLQPNARRPPGADNVEPYAFAARGAWHMSHPVPPIYEHLVHSPCHSLELTVLADLGKDRGSVTEADAIRNRELL